MESYTTGGIWHAAPLPVIWLGIHIILVPLHSLVCNSSLVIQFHFESWNTSISITLSWSLDSCCIKGFLSNYLCLVFANLMVSLTVTNSPTSVPLPKSKDISTVSLHCGFHTVRKMLANRDTIAQSTAWNEETQLKRLELWHKGDCDKGVYNSEIIEY